MFKGLSLPDLSDSLESDIQQPIGLIEQLDIDYDSVGSSAVLEIQEQVTSGVWKTRWSTGTANTDATHCPARTNTLEDGTAGSLESHVVLRSPLGWKLVASGEASGSINTWFTSR